MVAIKTVLDQIHQAERDYQRSPGSVRLLAVTKGRDIQAISAAVEQGQHAFGENYLQEALEKIAALAPLVLEWHFIGTLQANKTRLVAENFAWVHSLSRFKIAERLNNQRPPNLPPLNVCLEVNVSNEPTKSGILVDYLDDLAKQIQSLPRLKLRGLMVIPELVATFAQQRLIYKHVYNLQQTLIQRGFNLDTLSMGMSNDFIAAIAEGSTMVRIGAAIFRQGGNSVGNC